MNNHKPGTRTTIAIVHPQAIVRYGVRAILNPRVLDAVFLEFERPEQAYRHFERNGFADVLFLDCPVRRPFKKNRAEQSTMTRLFRKMSSIIVLPSAQPNMAAEAKWLGARGAIARDSQIDEVIDAYEGLFQDVPTNQAFDFEEIRTHRQPLTACERRAGVSLTPRQAEVLQHLVEGQTNKEIARSLGISVHTAKIHVSAVLKELNVNTRARACAIGRALLEESPGENPQRAGPRLEWTDLMPSSK